MPVCDPVAGSGAVEAAVTLIVEWVFTKGLRAIDLFLESAKTLRIIITAFNRFSGFAVRIARLLYVHNMCVVRV